MRRTALALGFLVAVLVPVVPAAAQEREPDIALATQTAWLGDEGSFDVVVQVDGAPDEAEVEVTVHAILRSRSAFVQSIEGRPRGTTTRLRASLAGLPTDEFGNHRVSLPLGGGEPGSLPAGLRQGVYPVTVALRDGDGDVVDRFVTHLVRLPDDPELTPLSVAWIQPLGADPALDGQLGGRQLAALSPVLDALGTTGIDLTLEATPETLATLPDSDLAPVRRVLDAGSQLPSRPYVDVDPDALVAAGLGADLAAQRQAGEDALFAAVGTRGDPRTWTSGAALGARSFSALRALGITQVALPTGAYEPLDDDVTDGKTLTRPFDLAAGGELFRAVAIDEGLTGHFEGDDQVLAAHRLLADLAVLFFDSPGTTRGVAVRPPDRWPANAAFLGTLLPALESAPVLQPVTLERLLATVDPLEDDGAAVLRTPAPAGRPGDLPATRIAAARSATDEVAQLIGPTAASVTASRLQVLVAESVDLAARQRRRLLDDVLAARDQIEARITIADRRTFRLTAREGTIPLTLVNENDVPVEIQLVLSSDKLEFTGSDGDDRTRAVKRLVLEPGTHTQTVPVRVRASGTFQVRASLLAPGGRPIRQGQFTITSSAFSGVGIVLSIGAGVFLLAWWASHWRTVRRDRRLVESPAQVSQ